MWLKSLDCRGIKRKYKQNLLVFGKWEMREKSKI